MNRRGRGESVVFRIVLLSSLWAAAGWPAAGEPGAAPALRLTIEGSREWRSALAGERVLLPIGIACRGGARFPGGFLEASWKMAESAPVSLPASAPLPLSPLEGGDSLDASLALRLPYAEEEDDSLVVSVRRAGEEEEEARAALSFGPTVPGRPIEPPDPGPVEEVDVCGTLVLAGGGGSVRPIDLAGDLSVGPPLSGGGGAAGRGFFLYERSQGIFRFDLATGESRALSDPDFPAHGPAAGKEDAAWFRICCGTRGELIVLPGRGERFAFPLERSPVGSPAVRGAHAAWLESDAARWTIWVADLRTKEKEAIEVSADTLSPPVLGDSTVCYAGRREGSWFLVRRLVAGGRADTLRGGALSIGRPAWGRGIVVWSEREEGERNLYGRRAEGGEVFPLSLALGDQTGPSLSDSILVWIDTRSGVAEIRGLVLDETRIPGGDGEEAPPSFDVLFELPVVVPGGLEVRWMITGRAGRGSFRLEREGRSGAGGTERILVADGAIDGPGRYAAVDTTLPSEGGRQRVRYDLRIEVPSGTLLFGPVAAVLPERFSSLLIERRSPNPATGDVRFTVGLPTARAGERIGIEVFDCRGRSVRVLEGRAPSGGRIPFRWDRTDRSGRTVSPGTYFFRFSIGSAYRETRKVIVLSP